MSRWFVTDGAMRISRILAEITIGVSRPVVVASLPAIVSSNETWKPLVAMPIQEVGSTTFVVTPALDLRTPMRWRLNAWAEKPTVPLSGAADAKLDFEELRVRRVELPKLHIVKVGSRLSSDKETATTSREFVRPSMPCNQRRLMA